MGSLRGPVGTGRLELDRMELRVRAGRYVLVVVAVKDGRDYGSGATTRRGRARNRRHAPRPAVGQSLAASKPASRASAVVDVRAVRRARWGDEVVVVPAICRGLAVGHRAGAGEVEAVLEVVVRHAPGHEAPRSGPDAIAVIAAALASADGGERAGDDSGPQAEVHDRGGVGDQH